VTPTRTINLLRGLFVSFAFFMGMRIGDVAFDSQIIGGLWGLVFSLAVVLADRMLKGFSLRIFSAATFGLLLGLLASRLLIASDMLLYVSEQNRWIISLAVYATMGYLGTMLAVRSNRDEFSLIIPYVRFRRTAVQDIPMVVDTSVIIDGRLPEVCQSGFLSTAFVVPRFVLDELQKLADSADATKRERGRRGLDLLSEMQRRPDMSVMLHESVTDPDVPVDSKLIQVSQLLQARLLTNDSNLARVARVQGVTVLSLAELGRALQPVVSTGEVMELTLVKPGKDAHQAVGFLPDGGMIVVNHARAHVGETVSVTIAGVLQTVSGRMYFAELTQPPPPARHTSRAASS
jgi:uncharacterized protein YacL